MPSQFHHDDINIRLAREEDCSSIADLLYRSFLEIKAVYTPGGFEATVLSPEKVFARMTEGPVWVALDHAIIAGTVSAVIKPKGLYMRGMAVDPERRGKHIGRLLLETVERYALHNNCSRFYFSTAPYLHNAIKLYENFGFVRTDEPPHELFGTPLFSMEYQISKSERNREY